jgi:hypothetical protein
MDEQGFDFKPEERREPKRFEPPPWEQAAFEELERTRAAQAPREPKQQREEEESGQPNEPPASKEQESAPSAAVPRTDGDVGPGQPTALDESQVIEMLAGLSEEDPARPRSYFTVAFGAGLFLVAVGGVLIIWAMAALVSSRQTGSVGQWSGAGLGMFGAFFLGMGAWMLYRTLKQRGVL